MGGGGDGGDGGGSTGGWGGWWSSSVTNVNDVEFYNYSTESNSVASQETESVPEPSSILALVALGGIGLRTRKKD
ncbi:MAG: PEP-CTERM sorting domain-containing protein [Crocosphaera sp.]